MSGFQQGKREVVQELQINADQFYAERDHRTNLSYLQSTEPANITVYIPDEWARTSVGQLTFLWTCSLIARMGRRYNGLQTAMSREAAQGECLIPGAQSESFATSVLTHLHESDPFGVYDWIDAPPAGSYVLAVGDFSGKGDSKVVRPVGWTAGLAAANSMPVISGIKDQEFNPIGAALAAALGAADVYFHFNRTLLPDYQPPDPIWISAQQSSSTNVVGESLPYEPGPSLAGDIDLGKLLVAGAGALGGNMLAILGTLRNLRGRIDISDNDLLDLSNLNRLVWALVHHFQQPKAKVAQALLDTSSIEATVHLQRYENLIRTSNEDFVNRFDVVVSGVDQMASRAFIQCGWPRLLIDGGTGGFNFRVSTFAADTQGGCAGCIAGNSQLSFNQLRAPMRCAGGEAGTEVASLRYFESYSFVSFFGAAFLAARVLQRALGGLATDQSFSTEADALYLAGMNHKVLRNSDRCLCLCGHLIAREYRPTKYSLENNVGSTARGN